MSNDNGKEPTTLTTPTTRMTKAELQRHQVGKWGRDYSESDDGYSDMEAEQRRGWHVQASWGARGWNLGTWPYVAFYLRDHGDGSYGLLEIVEGDRTEWRFPSAEERVRAIDYLFLWYAADQRWAPITADQRPALEAGYPLAIADKWSGPYREERT